ncbi:hypothetical protein RBH29_08715 [Herbivorax sp. ANBcel31]|uniref:hypothetical protein n=1 Tax=Herbivorax sp. ANBcel31 TaxID=3069754 RepID=UPI0027B6B2D1|nr:hypothetical protein [Herbivorax sp. ANBcel31]MDQ2086508.1 hypothetical protein [Herbivorax sp. ANBcel31]
MERNECMSFYKKEDRKKIEIINKGMGTAHRTKPYDLKKTDDLINYTEMITAEYMDMKSYLCWLHDIIELYDDSLEHFHPDIWINLTSEELEENDYSEASYVLTDLDGLFVNIVNKAEDSCYRAWKHVMESNLEKVHQHFFGQVISIDSEKFKEIFEKTILEVVNAEYQYNVSKSAKTFADNLKDMMLRDK